MSDKQNFCTLALELLTVVGAWFVLDRVCGYGGKLLLRLLKPRCRHTWVAGFFYQQAEYRVNGCSQKIGQFKCICGNCKAGCLRDAAIQVSQNGFGTIYFMRNNVVHEIIEVGPIKFKNSEYPKE